MRSLGAAAGLSRSSPSIAPGRLRLTRRELPYLLAFGFVGLAFVQWFYFLAIHRLAIGVALLIEYLAPLLVALWARFAYKDPVRRRIWAALALALFGLTLIVNLFGGGTSLSTAGVLFALAGRSRTRPTCCSPSTSSAAATRSRCSRGASCSRRSSGRYSPRGGRSRGSSLTRHTSLHGHLASVHLPIWLLALWMIALGTIVPFFLLVSALRHLSASRVAIVAMLEPVAGALVAWAWLGESLGGVQLVGAGVVLAAIGLAQTAR